MIGSPQRAPVGINKQLPECSENPTQPPTPRKECALLLLPSLPFEKHPRLHPSSIWCKAFEWQLHKQIQTSTCPERAPAAVPGPRPREPGAGRGAGWGPPLPPGAEGAEKPGAVARVTLGSFSS